MIALGVRADHPPAAIQPPLADGIHLRWAFERDAGFPWYGYFLYRRRAGNRERTCLASGFAGLVKVPAVPTGTVGADQLSSDQPLVTSDDFPAPGQPELDLGPFGTADRTFLRLGIHQGELAIEIYGQLGFRPAATKLICADLTAKDTPQRGFRIKPEPVPGRGVRLDAGAVIRLDPPCDEVRLGFGDLGQGVSAVGRDAEGRTVAKGDTAGQPALTLNTAKEPIVTVELRQHARSDVPVLLRELCRLPSQRVRRTVVLTGSRAGIPVASTTITGRPGDVVPFSMTADAMDEARFTGQDGAPLPDAALIELCYTPLLLTAGTNWAPLTGFPTPLALPLTHPDYPASGGKPEDEVAARSEADHRLRYPAPAGYGDPEFADLHATLVTLVSGGPGGAPMADPSRASALVATGTTVPLPTMPAQHPLDLLLLAGINPAMAQMLGLYRVDDTAAPGTAYDYLLLADNSGVSGGDPAKALAAWQQSDPGVDAAIVTNQIAGPVPALATPAGVRAYALPGGTIPAPAGADPPVIALAGSVGLRWQLPEYSDVLLPDSAVAYHLWRDGQGDATAPVPSDPLGDQLTAAGPAVVVEPITDPFHPVQWPPQWPSKALYRVDSVLDEGWYAYRVSGMDLFGRISPPSGPAPWYQWAPMPTPRPWYYTDPAAESVIHPSAVRIRDTVPPPAPPGVEATLLDPADPFLLRDNAYTAWRAGVAEDLVGLRVSWRWTVNQQRQAPKTAEFRIYWNAGTTLPTPDANDPLSYTDRVKAVPVGDGSPDADGNLAFEVFLPAPGDALEPSLADPIRYAHVGVSAADAEAHTADAAKWAAGAWGGRAGNEGRIGGPAKVFRVRRIPPPAPEVPADSERVYATPADYTSTSYYTYRWVPGTNLTTHVFRALDESVYAADWRERPRAPLAASDPAAFPAEPRWDNAKRTQVAEELNALNDFPQTSTGKAQALAAYRTLSNDALRVLAGLTGTERAFTQVTTTALDPASPDTANRVGPDNPVDFPVDPSLRAHVDALDGRSTNRYFYRSSYVDAAQNRGPLSLSGSPVWLPKVAAPRTPSIRSVAGGECIITITWAANREADLAEYRVYRADSEAGARDPRAMTLVHTEPVGERPAQVVWVDQGVPPRTTLWYRLAAVDTAGNVSVPSDPVAGRAFRSVPPAAPDWAAGSHDAAGVHLAWTYLETGLAPMVQRRPDGSPRWVAVTGWLTPDTSAFDDTSADPASGYYYRVLVRDASGAISMDAPALLVPPAP